MNSIRNFVSTMTQNAFQQVAGLKARNDVVGSLSSVLMTRTFVVALLGTFAYQSLKRIDGDMFLTFNFNIYGFNQQKKGKSPIQLEFHCEQGSKVLKDKELKCKLLLSTICAVGALVLACKKVAIHQ